MGAFHKYSATCFYARHSQDFQLMRGTDIVQALSSVLCLLYPPPFHWSRESRNHTAHLLDPAVVSAGALSGGLKSSTSVSPVTPFSTLGFLSHPTALYLQTSLHFVFLPRILPVAFDLLLVLSPLCTTQKSCCFLLGTGRYPH